MRMTRSVFAVALLTAAIRFTAPAGAQDNEPAPAVEPTVITELVKLNATMTEIARLLKTSVEQKETELDRQEDALVIRRLELALKKVAPLQEELSRAKQVRDEKESSLRNMKEEIANLEDAIKKEKERGTGEQVEQLELFRERFLRQIQATQEEISALAKKEIQLDSELYSSLEDLETLEKTLDQRLGIR